jgi:DNA-binding beta-propeller fold protein YncE
VRSRISVRSAAALAVALAVALVPAGADAAKRKKTKRVKRAAAPVTREILTVANNWEGTADFVDPKTFKSLARINIVPDLDERMAEIQSSPDRLGYFIAIRELIGEGHDQFVDDGFTSVDGRRLFVSRPSLADVVAIDLQTKKIVWRTPVEGYRADHMAISADGSRLLVSASTAAKVHVIDTSNGKIVANFESGESPHENNYSRDGSRIFHASIGKVYTPLDDPLFDFAKGDRWFEIVDAHSYKVLKRLDMGQKLAEAGYPDMSSAVRPMALSPDEHYLYFQVSFFHGFVEYDLLTDRVTRVAVLPESAEVQKMQREQYLLDSAHHGLAMDPGGTKLCVAGTMDGYAAIVSRTSFDYTMAAHGHVPYWATNSTDGKYCFVSFAGDDQVSAISYATGQQVARINVGDHPQRMRMGVIRREFLPAG